MPRLPKELLKSIALSFNKVSSKMKEMKNSFLIYSFLFVVFLEALSLFLIDSSSYCSFIYALLSQIEILVLCVNLALYSDRLKFCKRKEMALYVLSFNYLFNVISLIFGLNNYVYSIVVNVVLLGLSAVLVFKSLKKQ